MDIFADKPMNIEPRKYNPFVEPKLISGLDPADTGAQFD
jgi:hypothetical protein